VALEPALVELARALGDDQIVTDPEICAAYAKDESEADPVVPAAVIRARSTADVSAVMGAASKHSVPVTPRAAGTGRVGGAVPVPGGIVLSLERMGELKDIDGENAVATVEPGLVTGELHRRAESEGLFYPPDPNSWTTCTVGGNIATNAGGPRAFKYGVTREYVLGLECVTADGAVLHLGRRTRKGVTGYDLTALVVGSEGTLAIVTEATLKLVPLPEAVTTLAVFLQSEAQLAELAGLLRRARIEPQCLEFLDALTLAVLERESGFRAPAGTQAMVLLDLDSGVGEMDALLERTGNLLTEAGALEVLAAKDAAGRERLWAARREMSRSLRKVAAHKLSEDVVVPVSALAALLSKTRELAERHALTLPAYGHAGDGNLHVNFLWNTPEEWTRVKLATRELFEATISLGGTLSGEHGIGILKAPYLSLEQSPELIALEERVKATFDPQGVLNPGKIFPAAAKRFHGAC
jgi:glycolate oxidase